MSSLCHPAQEEPCDLRFDRGARFRIPLVACSFDVAAPLGSRLLSERGIGGNRFCVSRPASVVIANEGSHPRFVIGKILDHGSWKGHRKLILEALCIRARYTERDQVRGVSEN